MELLTTFGIQPILLAAQVVNFVVLFLILYRLFYRPLQRVFDERRRRIAESMRRADEIDARYQKLGEEERRVLAHAQTQAATILENAKNTAEEIRAVAARDAKDQTERMIRAATAEIQQNRTAMVERAKGEIATLVVSLARSVFEKSLSGQMKKQALARAEKEVQARA